ncbi:14803_t:CDS:1, partial [Cetraspora pellucida]
ESCNNTNTNKQTKTSYKLDNIYLKETNKNNIKTFFKDLDNKSKNDKIENKNAIQQ